MQSKTLCVGSIQSNAENHAVKLIAEPQVMSRVESTPTR